MKNLVEYRNYASGNAYFEGAEGMGNEVSMLYIAGALLLKNIVRNSSYGGTLGGLGPHLGENVARNLPRVTIFDVCCGPGNVPNYLSLVLPNAIVSGLDCCELFIEEANRRFKDIGWHFLCGDARSFQLNQKFNFITGSSAYHHIEDEYKITFLKNLALHLEGEGRIILCDNFLPYYQDESLRTDAVNKYYELLKDYYRKGGGNSAAISAIDGSHQRDLKKQNEFKVSFSIFLEQVSAAGLTIDEKIAVWQPAEFASTSAGSYVISLRKLL